MNRNFILFLFFRWKSVGYPMLYKLLIIRKKKEVFFSFSPYYPIFDDAWFEQGLLLRINRKFHFLGNECFNLFFPHPFYLFISYILFLFFSWERFLSNIVFSFPDSSSLPIFHYLPSPSVPRSSSRAFIFDVKSGEVNRRDDGKKKKEEEKKTSPRYRSWNIEISPLGRGSWERWTILIRAN